MAHAPPTPTWLLTLRAYGTRLPGAAEGWTSRATSRSPSRYREANPALEAHSRRIMRWPPMRFDTPRRALVRDAIRGLCVEQRWELHALAVTSDHVHALVTSGAAPVELRRAIKRDVTMALKLADLVPREVQVWADYGNVWRINSEARFHLARAYVHRHNRRSAGGDGCLKWR